MAVTHNAIIFIRTSIYRDGQTSANPRTALTVGHKPISVSFREPIRETRYANQLIFSFSASTNRSTSIIHGGRNYYTKNATGSRPRRSESGSCNIVVS